MSQYTATTSNTTSYTLAKDHQTTLGTHFEGGNTIASTSTPFYLADYDEDDDDHDCHNNRNHHRNNAPHHLDDDGCASVAAASATEDFSTTEGIDVIVPSFPRPGQEGKHNFLHWFRYQTARLFLTNKAFKRSMLGSILLSSILLGIRTTVVYYHRDDDDDDDNQVRSVAVLDTIMRAFQILFTVESLMKVLYYQKDILDSGWMMLDLFVIASSWLWNNTTLLVILAVRWIKALSKAAPVLELKHIIKALLNSLLKLWMVALLFVWILYIFSVLFTDLYQQQQQEERQLLAEDETDYFSRLDKTAMTLFQIMTGGILWSELLSQQQLQDENNSIAGVMAWNVLFVVYVATALFVFGGLFLAIVYEAIHESQERLFWKSFQDGKLHKSKKKNPHMNDNSNSSKHQTMRTFGNSPPFQKQQPIPTATTSLSPPLAADLYDISSTTVHRLEQRMEHMTSVLEQMMRMQKNLQESIHRLEKEKILMGERTRSDETG